MAAIAFIIRWRLYERGGKERAGTFYYTLSSLTMETHASWKLFRRSRGTQNETRDLEQED